jgi:hypothetical protein
LFVELDPARGPHATRLCEMDVFTSLEVRVAGDQADRAQLERALGAVGTLHGEEALLDVGQLLGLAGPRAQDPEWTKGFHAMIDWAAAHGWVDAHGAVRAHLVLER